MRDDDVGSNSGEGKPVSGEPRATKVACTVQKSMERICNSSRYAPYFVTASFSNYLLVGVLGFIAPGVIERTLQIHTTTESVNLMPDNIVHLLVGAVFLIVGFLREPQTVTPTGSKAD
jgi:hypothetical protein